MTIDVAKWLAEIGLPQHAELFRDQGFDAQGLSELSDSDLANLGIMAMGHRKILLREAAKLSPKTGTPSVEPSRELDKAEPQTIFLSYAHRSEREEDFDVSEELVLLIQEELQRDGHTVWIDKEGIRAGSQWRERITAAILEHAHFLSFLSIRSVRAPGVCLNEIAIALGHGKNIQTVLAQDERRVAPPLTISHIQWHDFQDWREIRAGSKTGPKGENWHTWFRARMEQLRETLSSAQNARMNGDLQKLRDILEPRTFEARIVEKTTNFYGRKWLFDAAEDWLNNSTSRIFWLKGSPGIGKSAFAAMLAHRASSAVIGFFMCDFQGRKDPEESAREAICTLAFQIATRLPDYRLKLLYERLVDKDKVTKRSADDLFEFLITEPLNRSSKIPESTRLCFVIDALDEAGRSGGGNALAELLAKHAERLPEWLGVFVTSRPEPYLEQMLETLSGTSVYGHSEQNRQDLGDWISKRLPAILQGEERQQVIEAVLEKSGGAFLYLSLVEKDQTLSLADPSKLPDKLDGFFRQTFIRYFSKSEDYANKTEPFLRLMAAAPGPLPAEMGRQILRWGQRELTINVIEPMGSLLQERRGGLTFFHASLGDWLQDPTRSGGWCVASDGTEVLGEFLWDHFQTLERSRWREEVIQWLPLLLPHTKHWSAPKEVEAICIYLDEDSRFRPALELARRNLELLRQQPKISPQEIGRALHRIGLINGKLFRPEQSRQALLEALKFLDPSEGELIGDILDAIGTTYKAQARLREAAEAVEFSLKIKAKSSGVSPVSQARSLDLLGDITDAMGDFRGARRRFEEALALHMRDGGLSSAGPDIAALLNNLGIVTLRLNCGLVFGRFKPLLPRSRAFVAAERMLRMAARLVDAGEQFAPRPDLLAYTNNLAIALHGSGEAKASLTLLQGLDDRFVKFRGDDHPDRAIVLNNMGATFDTIHAPEDSRRAYDKAIRIFDRGEGSQHPHLARCLNNLGALLFSERAFDEAKECLVDAHRILKGKLGDGHIDTAQCMSNLAAVDLLQDRPELAVNKLRDVLVVRSRELGSDHLQVCSTKLILAKALYAVGDTETGGEMAATGLQSLGRCLGVLHPMVQLLSAKYGSTDTEIINQHQFLSEENIDDKIENLLYEIEKSVFLKSKIIPSSRGADGSYRMQLKIIDIIFSHDLLDYTKHVKL